MAALQCGQCGATGAVVCGTCWRSWPGAAGLTPSRLVSAATDRRQSAAVERLLTGPLTSLVGELLRAAPACAHDMYGSHVLQSAVAALGRALATTVPPPAHLEAAAVDCADALLVSSWRAAAADSCSTHVARSLIMLLAGACPTKRKPHAARKGAPADAWPVRVFPQPPTFSACQERVAAAAATALRAGGAQLACDTHAAPVLVVLLQALKRTHTSAEELLDALLGVRSLSRGGVECEARRVVQRLVSSPAGSRVLEAALASASPETFDTLLQTCVLPSATAWLGGATRPVAAQDAAPEVSFVLAADGSARAFKPGLDESQWWCRRDAHARIAAAALWSANGAPQPGVHECALLYADASLMRMQAAPLVARCTVPTEGALVAAWRDAAMGKRVPGVRAWRPSEEEPYASLRASFHELFAAPAPHTARGRTVVCLLHEDYPVELPVWGRQHGGASDVARIIFLLGAVRDLTDDEQQAAADAAYAAGYDFVGCNLGRMPEFSSKIVAALCVHHANARLVPALAALARRSDAAAAVPKLQPAAPRRAKRSTHVRFVVSVPFASGDLSLDFQHRAAMHPLLQMCVCALWRSRLADEEQQSARAGAAELSCSLSVVFADGALMTVGSALVATLAAAHQAAPSENQVLGALVDAVKTCQRCGSSDDAVRCVLAELPAAAVVQLTLDAGGTATNLASLGYADRCSCAAHSIGTRHGDVVVLADVPAPDVLRARLAPAGHATSAASAVTFVQQLFYHGRLFPALDLLRAGGARCDTAPINSSAVAPKDFCAAASSTSRFIVSGCFDSLHNAEQLRLLLRCVSTAGLPASSAAGVLAAAASAALRLGAAHDDVAALVFSSCRTNADVWPALLCGADGGPCEAGCSLLSLLLRFPPGDAVAPLRRGFRALLRGGGAPHLRDWALHNDGSRALEAALLPTAAALPAKLKRRAVRAYLHVGVQSLCVHPKASWLVAALWAATEGGRAQGVRSALREAFAAQLLSVAELHEVNPRLWELCELDAWKPAAKRTKRK